MRRKLSIFYAVFLLILMLAGNLSAVIFAWGTGVENIVKAIVGLVLGVVFAPILHELGHVIFAKLKNMEIVFVKCFCFAWQRQGDKLRFSFVSPFADDQTQVIPKSGENMQNRFLFYTVGGLLVEGAFFFTVLAVAIMFTAMGEANYLFWGIVPYAGYLFFLNVAPLEYASGKTDVLIYQGVKKGEDVERAMVLAMHLQGRLYAGETYAQMEEEIYQKFPVLCEDEPMFAMILEMKYRFYLEKGDLQNAADCLNRLVGIQEYLPDMQVQKIAAELVYLHSLNEDFERAKDSAKYCENYLKSNEITAKRALIAYCRVFGKEDAVAPLLSQAKELLKKERVRGYAKSEEILFHRFTA